MVKIISFFTVIFLVCIFADTNAQGRVINGIVTTFDSIPIVGASIKVKSTKQVILSDSVGNFNFTCAAEEVIHIMAKGFYTQKVKLAPGIKFAAVNLEIKPGRKNREYALGYGKVSEREKLYALVNFTDDDVDFSSYISMYELLRGRFAGVEIQNGEIFIRGERSILGSSAALIILDGVPVDSNILFDIPPGEVKRIDIIKDSGAAVYGSRGANGVVIVETKGRGL